MSFQSRVFDFKSLILQARADPDKVQVIQDMKEPENISELRNFLGMTTQLSKFTPHLSETTKLLCDLLSTKNT